MKKTSIPALVLILFTPAPVLADGLTGFEVQAGVSTLGLTLQPSYRLGRYLGFSAPMGYATASISGDIDGFGYDANLTTGGIGLTADFYLGESGWRLAGGAIFNNLGAELNFEDTVTIDGTTFNNVDISANIRPELSVAPMATLGYAHHFSNSWGISADIGAIYMGGLVLEASDASGQVDQNDLNDYLSDITDELAQIGVYPYLKLSISVAF